MRETSAYFDYLGSLLPALSSLVLLAVPLLLGIRLIARAWRWGS